MEIKVGSKLVVECFFSGRLDVYTVKSIFYCIDSSDKPCKDKKAYLVENSEINVKDKIIFEDEIYSIAVPYRDKNKNKDKE